MTFVLLEKKLVLQEHKLILNEDLTKDLVSEKLNLVNNALKSFESKTSPYSSIEAAYNDYKSIIVKNHTTRDNTTNYGEVIAALRTFWNSLKTAKLIKNNDINLDFENSGDTNTDATAANQDEIIKILKPHRRLITEVNSLLATVGNDASEIAKETKKKLVLKNVIEVESAFGNIVQKLKTEATVADTTAAPFKSKLSFIQKSLTIFQQSINYLTDKKIREELEIALNTISETSLKNAESLGEIVDVLRAINIEIKNSKDAKAQQRAENSEANKNLENTNWNELYDNTINKTLFWEKYYREYWGQEANRIASLGTAFKNECETYGFTSKTNPFIRYIKNYLLSPALENLWNSGQYQLIHNFIVSGRGVTIKDLPGYGNKIVNGLSDLLTKPELFKQKASDMHDYLTYAAAAKDNPNFKTYFYGDSGQLLSLPVIKQELANAGIDNGSVPMTSSTIQSCINEILALRKEEIYLVMLWSYFLDETAQAEYRGKLGDLLNKTSISPSVLAAAKNKFVNKYGEPSLPIARQLIDGLQNARAMKVNNKQTNTTRGV